MVVPVLARSVLRYRKQAVLAVQTNHLLDRPKSHISHQLIGKRDRQSGPVAASGTDYLQFIAQHFRLLVCLQKVGEAGEAEVVGTVEKELLLLLGLARGAEGSGHLNMITCE